MKTSLRCRLALVLLAAAPGVRGQTTAALTTPDNCYRNTLSDRMSQPLSLTVRG